MKNAEERREVRRRQRQREQEHKQRQRERKERKRLEERLRREQKRAREKERRTRQKQQRIQGKQNEANVFNAISTVTHNAISKVLSSLRLSLGLRISWNYTLRILHMMVNELLLCVLAFVVLEIVFLGLDAQRTIAPQMMRVQQGERIALQSSIPAVEATFAVASDRQVEAVRVTGRYTQGFAGIRFESPTQVQVYFAPYIQVTETSNMFTVRLAEPLEQQMAYTITLGEASNMLLARYELHYHMLILYGALMLIVVINLTTALGFVLNGRRINQKVLGPIGHITETAQLLSENDLGQRINVEGTNNELKDLALVINDMLDRIELAYNAQKQFVSDASHELRTPIAVIQGYANLLERWGKDSPEVRDEAITAILSESAAMKDLVEKLLFLARHDKKTMRLKPERFDVQEVVEETLRETRMIAKDHTIIEGEMASAQVDADRAALKQALRIFVDNAVKYTPEGKTVTVSCKHHGTQVAISVCDTGAGISGSELSAIFERFYRADAARTSETGGHGLGLSIAKIIILAHGGKINVKSKLGEGSTFTMLLPRM